MKEKKAIKDYFDKKKRKPCHVGHIEHTNECPHCVAIHGYKIKTPNRLWGELKGRKR